MPSAIELLKQDHRAVEKLFSEYESSGDEQVVAEICSELEVHTEVEERLVYPVLRSEVTGGERLADEAEEEHREAKQLIGRLKRSSKDEHLAELVGELKAAIEHHVDEEEHDVFPKMEAEVGRARLDEIGAEIERMKQQKAA